MRVCCPNCDRPYAERNFVPGAARRCPLCDEIIFLPMEPVPEAYLVPLEGEGAETRIALAARTTVGRAHECDIRVLDGTLSRQHAEICLADGQFVICDLGSRNKVIINGQTTVEGPLSHGDVIRLGNRAFRFEKPAREARPAAWTPEERVRLGGGEESSETSSTVGASTSESARLLAALNLYGPRKAPAATRAAGELDPATRTTRPVPALSLPPESESEIEEVDDFDSDDVVAFDKRFDRGDRRAFDTANRSYDGRARDEGGISVATEIDGSTALAPDPMPETSQTPQPLQIRLLPDLEPDLEPQTVIPAPPQAVPLPDPTRTYATLLCAELYGISELALSPEPRRAIDAINRYLAILVDTARRHGAFVDQVNGELVQAFWVAPTVNSRCPQEAVECALEIHVALNELNAALASEGLVPVQVAMAIHSGEAVAGELGAGAHREFAVVGETVHLAGRLRSCARPGEILMTEASYGLIEGVAKTLLMPYMELPGFSGHGHIYTVQGLQRR